MTDDTNIIEIEKAELISVPRTALSMPEFAKSFGVSKSMAYGMMRKGLFKSFMIGRRRFVSMEETRALATRLTGQVKP